MLMHIHVDFPAAADTDSSVVPHELIGTLFMPVERVAGLLNRFYKQKDTKCLLNRTDSRETSKLVRASNIVFLSYWHI